MPPVFVLDAARRPRMPCRTARARLLLTPGTAAVLRCHPVSIVLQEASPRADVAPLPAKRDPGSRTTGLALVLDQRGQSGLQDG